jgi:hypothetical protein
MKLVTFVCTDWPLPSWLRVVLGQMENGIQWLARKKESPWRMSWPMNCRFGCSGLLLAIQSGKAAVLTSLRRHNGRSWTDCG